MPSTKQIAKIIGWSALLATIPISALYPELFPHLLNRLEEYGRRSGLMEEHPDKIIEMLRHPRDPIDRSRAAVSLRQLRNPRSVEPLIKAAHDTDESVRVDAIRALGNFRDDSRALDTLVAALDDSSHSVVLAAAVQLGEIGDVLRAAETLIASLKNDQVPARDLVSALAALGPGAVDKLVFALKDENQLVREQVSLALGKINDTRGVSALLSLLKDVDPRARTAAVRGLAEADDVRIDDALLGVLKAQDLPVIFRTYDTVFFEKAFPGSEDLLVAALDRIDSKQMAEDFLNSGNTLLIDGAEKWAARKGYKETSRPAVVQGPRWGRR